MITEVKSRQEARIATEAPNAPLTAIISITDVGGLKNRFYSQPWLVGVLEIQFDDVVAGEKNCITFIQAREIAKFIWLNYAKVERFIIHCEFGQSRSSGVAAAINQYYVGSSGGIFGNRAYNPNPTCYEYVLKALRKKKRWGG